MATPQFGEAPPQACPDRPAAFAVIERDGLIALVQVPRIHNRLALDLPGGGIDSGETAGEAAVRECGEEAGLRVALDAEPFVSADHYFLHGDGEIRNTRGVFFSGRVVAEDPGLTIEDDHTLVWTDADQAILHLDRESHAWAVAAWLRLRAGA